jgi:hypothetical protein
MGEVIGHKQPVLASCRRLLLELGSVAHVPSISSHQNSREHFDGRAKYSRTSRGDRHCLEDTSALMGPTWWTWASQQRTSRLYGATTTPLRMTTGSAATGDQPLMVDPYCDGPGDYLFFPLFRFLFGFVGSVGFIGSFGSFFSSSIAFLATFSSPSAAALPLKLLLSSFSLVSSQRTGY